MKLLYVAVHRHQGWGAEYWLGRAFEELGISLERLDFRALREDQGYDALPAAIEKGASSSDGVLLQRADNLGPELFAQVRVPIIFWSTEPIVRNRDVDKLLASDVASWVFLHVPSCRDRVARDFPHLASKSSILHNAAPKDCFDFDAPKDRFAIFNRSVSMRRRWWLGRLSKQVDVATGRFGDAYFQDLARSHVAINIHVSRKSLDDFETGIFEALTKGCAIVSERVPERTARELGMEEAIWQVDSPRQMRAALQTLRNDPERLKSLKDAGVRAIQQNTWHHRAQTIIDRFNTLLGEA